jgi:cysteine protease ATG4
MLVGTALARLRGGWGARIPSELVPLFHDTPGAPLSIHAITTLGLEKWGKGIGEWFGPSTISVVLSELVARHTPCGMTSLVLPEMMIVRDQVEAAVVSPRLHGGPSPAPGGEAPWRPLLLWIPVRLGVESINPIYMPSLLAYFRSPQSLGVLGGRDPRHATYFYASQGPHAFYLDPHTVQPASDTADLASYTCTDLHSMPLASADPSMALAFLCVERADFEALCSFVAGIADGAAEKGHALIKVVQSAPVMQDFDDDWAEDGASEAEDNKH